MLLQVILEGIGLGVLLILVCAIGIRKGAVGMVHLYSPEVQERCVTLGLTTHAKIKRNALIFKAVCVPGYLTHFVLISIVVQFTNTRAQKLLHILQRNGGNIRITVRTVL